jgi:hypothetical protein
MSLMDSHTSWIFSSSFLESALSWDLAATYFDWTYKSIISLFIFSLFGDIGSKYPNVGHLVLAIVPVLS